MRMAVKIALFLVAVFAINFAKNEYALYQKYGTLDRHEQLVMQCLDLNTEREFNLHEIECEVLINEQLKQ